MRAGGVTPATRPSVNRHPPHTVQAFNEGRGGYPGDASIPGRVSSTPTPFNEGRGGYPGDALRGIDGRGRVESVQ